MPIETWFMLEDGSFAHPDECYIDDEGRFRSKSGVPVAMKGERGDFKTSSVDVDAERVKADEAKAKAKAAEKAAADDAKRKAVHHYKDRGMK